MRFLVGTFAFILTLALSACGGPAVDEVCKMEADCYVKNCRYPDAVCEKQAEYVEQGCALQYNQSLDVMDVSDGEACAACKDSQTALIDCLATINSCERWDVAQTQDGDCYQQSLDADSDCDHQLLGEQCYP